MLTPRISSSFYHLKSSLYQPHTVLWIQTHHNNFECRQEQRTSVFYTTRACCNIQFKSSVHPLIKPVCLSVRPCFTLTQILTLSCGDRKFGVSLLRVFWVSVSQMRKHTLPHTHTPVCLIKTFPIDVLLSTHHHLQSPQPLPSFERHFLFPSRHLSPFISLPLSRSLCLPRRALSLCCHVPKPPIYLLSCPLILSLIVPPGVPWCQGQGRRKSFVPFVLKTWVSEPR